MPDLHGNMPNALSQRQHLLIEGNVGLLEQAQRLLDSISDSLYADSPAGFAPHRVGGHLRHVLEFYECLLEGVESGHVDYDARRRDEAIATSRHAAKARIQTIVERLRGCPALRGDMLIWIRAEDAPREQLGDPFLTSSPARELQVLSSHTIHHFALIAMTLRAHGVAVSPDFGMAPSTLRYLASKRAA